MSLAVVGADHPNKKGPTRRFEIAVCPPGERVDLIPEPKNPADPHAIAVFSVRGVQLGYLTAERAPYIGSMMKTRIYEAVFQQATSYGCLIRLAFDGEAPILPEQAERPAPRAKSSDDDGFWPDPIYDDE